MNMPWPYSCIQNNLRLRRQVKTRRIAPPFCGVASDRRHDEVTRTGINRQILAVPVAPPKGITEASMLAV